MNAGDKFYFVEEYEYRMKNTIDKQLVGIHKRQSLLSIANSSDHQVARSVCRSYLKSLKKKLQPTPAHSTVV